MHLINYYFLILQSILFLQINKILALILGEIKEIKLATYVLEWLVPKDWKQIRSLSRLEKNRNRLNKLALDLVRFNNLLWTKYYKINVTRGHSVNGHSFTLFWRPTCTYLEIYPDRGQKWIFLEHLPTWSCPRRVWTTLYVEHFLCGCIITAEL